MKNYLIIHGHFYQPPREDPWTGKVPFQSSAYPFHDWNMRITKECYGANTASRILNPDGNIGDMVNNYEYLSFNFGPTLFSWLKENAPNVYRRIIEADNRSRDKNNGHGNAIAQAYNHTILPLSSIRDVKTQIIWGLKDFKFHFGRDAEGIWLPETAINERVVDILIEEGVKFVILSPWQAQAYRIEGKEEWMLLEDNPIYSNRVYKIKRGSGELAVFFYNHILAQGISFDHYLRNAETLYEKILGFYKKEDKKNLISVATDGEVYGHHEPFGDMCLAALTGIVERDEKLQFTNYANYLQLFPPEREVKLKTGEDDLGTSWSCVHGVSRWYKNCGCSTGGKEGWTQEWRTPLRRSFEELSQRLKEIYLKEIKSLTSLEPEEVRNTYISVITGEIKRDDFAEEIIDKKQTIPDNDRKKLFYLLEGQKYGMYMFTSCGWFFAELSGLEPVQNIKYAVKAIQLYTPFAEYDLLEPFLKQLEEAKSNIPDEKNGRVIAIKRVLPIVKKLDYPAAIFIILECIEAGSRSFGIYRLLSSQIEKKQPDEHSNLYSGEVIVQDTILLENASFYFELVMKNGHDIKLKMGSVDAESGYETVNPFDLGKLPYDVKRLCFSYLARPVEEHCILEGRKLFPSIQKVLKFSQKIGVKPGAAFKKASELSITCNLLSILSEEDKLLNAESLKKIEELIVLAASCELDIEQERIKKRISDALSSQVDRLTKNVEPEIIEYIYQLLKISRKGGINPEITIPQNVVFYFIRENAEAFYREMENGKIEGLRKLRGLIKLGSQLGIDVENLKQMVLSA
ncbi:MAG: glycoside hydrolase [Spirochaetes bacterium]|nr:MAG: glycoside hydrolase [Spirochaetota bacterium]